MTHHYRPPTTEDILSVAARMRDADVLEVAASSGHTPIQALTESVMDSEQSFCFVVDGVPHAIFGFDRTGSRGDAIVWLLAADSVKAHRKLFLRESRRIVNAWAEEFTSLYNWVAEDNLASLRWLEWLGFRCKRARYLGDPAEMFFLMERDCV